MPYNKVLKGKDRVIPWLRAAAADQKKPVVISNAVADNWGVFEYWNIGIVSDAVINLGNKQGCLGQTTRRNSRARNTGLPNVSHIILMPTER
jgi:hypothetical protein